jgi:hypothetical protein
VPEFVASVADDPADATKVFEGTEPLVAVFES